MVKNKEGNENPNKGSKKVSGWLYAFILEVIANFFTDGPANYSLTEEELKIENQFKKTNKFKDFIMNIAIAVIICILMFFLIKFGWNNNIIFKTFELIFFITIVIIGIRQIRKK